jgi:hypothetical protein
MCELPGEDIAALGLSELWHYVTLKQRWLSKPRDGADQKEQGPGINPRTVAL